jgi:HEAT repeat protein
MRFFPKEMEDALKELGDPEGDEETRFDAMAKIARMRGLEGATDPLKKDAFDPVLARALESRQDTFADGAGIFLAALDRDRLAVAVKKAVAGEKDPGRLRSATFLAEALGPPEGVAALVDLAAGGMPAGVRTRAVEALGTLGAPEGAGPAADLLRSPDLQGRNVAALALGRLGDVKSAPALLGGLGEAKGGFGWFCAEALGLLEDPGLFDAILARSASGASAGPRARAMENCARPRNVEALVGILQKSPARELRAAAANALGRLAAVEAVGDGEVAAKGPVGDREAVADALLEGVVSDKEPEVRAACLWSLRRCSTPQTGPKAVKRLLTVQGDDKLLFLLTILGEQRVQEAGLTLLKSGILGAKQPMIRRASGVAFWQIAEPASVQAFKEMILGAKDAGTLERLCEALGSWRSKEGFDTAVQLLRTTREGSREQFSVMLALEKMTGHYFGPFPGIWVKWYERNPHFFSPKQEKVERDKWREEFDKENKGFRHTKETEKAVQMGLGWLARHQAGDGVWDATAFLNQCDPASPCGKKAGARTQFSQAGFTGLSSLCFTGAGYAPLAGKYRHTLRRGLDALVATQSVDGDYEEADYLWNRSYARPVALQALAEGYSATGDPRYHAAASRIMAREFALMNERGGWRYALQRNVPELDSSVTAWVVFALKSADKAGLRVPRLLWEGPYLAFDHLSQRVPAKGPYEELLEDAGDYGVDVGKGKEDYLFITGYQDASGGPGRATTPLGIMSRIFLGWRRTHPFCIGSANYVMKTYLPEFDVFGEPGKENWGNAGRFTPKAIWPMYNFYYCTLALHQMGGSYFYKWNRRISRVLPYLQNKTGCERGSFPAKYGVADDNQGWVYATCMGVLTLETYYRYAPILSD